MWHSCTRYTLEQFFAGCEPHVPRLFKKFARMVRACGPVRVIPQKTRVAFQVRVRFGGAVRRKSYLLCGLALPRILHHPRFIKIESFAPHFHGHWFRVDSERDLDAEVRRWIQEAYGVGAQRYLEGRSARSRPRAGSGRHRRA